MPIYYINRKTGKIEGKFVNCDTQSTLFRNTELYERRETKEELLIQGKPIVILKKEPWHKSLKRRIEKYVKGRLHIS